MMKSKTTFGISIIASSLISLFLGYAIPSQKETKAVPVQLKNNISINNNNKAWGYKDGKLPVNPCGVKYNLKEVAELGNLVNLNNCPKGTPFENGIGKPYQITSVIYQKYYKSYEPKIWLSMIRSAYHSYLDYWDYLDPPVYFNYFDQTPLSSLYIEVGFLGNFYCVGPNVDYIKSHGNTYVIKGAQAQATNITQNGCKARIVEAQATNFKIIQEVIKTN